MGRWSQYDDDEQRLPEGMRRVGYDADTQVYTYQDEDGTYWEGPAGARYGQLRRVGDADDDSDDDLPVAPSSNVSRIPEEWRYLAPFFLLIGLFLLGVYTMLGGGSMLWGDGDNEPLGRPKISHVNRCAENLMEYHIEKGDTCWNIADARGMAVEALIGMNKGVDCGELQVSQMICVVPV